ncbi:MAG: L-asparaginase 1 [Bacteroidota bacterium]
MPIPKSKSRSRASVLLIYTGGTIGMIRDHKTGALKPVDFKQISDEVPEIGKFNYSIDVVSFNPVIDSSNMGSEHWIRMAEIIKKNYDKYTGFVILHGTDTMAYTASALSFMLENLSKPVVITGAMLPVREVRTDARENLITAIEIAAHTEKGKPFVPEVCVYFDYLLFRGNRVTKVNASKFEAFASLNYPPLAEAGVHIRYNHHLIQRQGKGKLKTHLQLDTAVGIIRLFPGMTRQWFASQMRCEGLKAVIIETYGNGNAPTADWFLEELELAARHGLIIVSVTQCRGGMVEQGVYATSKGLEQLGVIGCGDITVESAMTKLMILLGRKLKTSEVKKLMGVSIAGEIM